MTDSVTKGNQYVEKLTPSELGTQLQENKDSKNEERRGNKGLRKCNAVKERDSKFKS